MMRFHVELVDDLIKLAILILSGLGAWYSRRAHRVAQSVDRAVNGVTDPNSQTLRENVQDLHDAMPPDK